MRSKACRNVEGKVAGNKQYFHKEWNQAREQVEQQAHILVEVGQIAQRMDGGLKYKYTKPFTITAVDGRMVKHKEAEEGKAKTSSRAETVRGNRRRS